MPVEDAWVLFLQLLNHLLSVIELQERWLQASDGVQDFHAQLLIGDGEECFLKNVVAELVVDEFLDDEAYSLTETFVNT